MPWQFNALYSKSKHFSNLENTTLNLKHFQEYIKSFLKKKHLDHRHYVMFKWLDFLFVTWSLRYRCPPLGVAAPLRSAGAAARSSSQPGQRELLQLRSVYFHWPSVLRIHSSQTVRAAAARSVRTGSVHPPPPPPPLCVCPSIQRCGSASGKVTHHFGSDNFELFLHHREVLSAFSGHWWVSGVFMWGRFYWQNESFQEGHVHTVGVSHDRKYDFYCISARHVLVFCALSCFIFKCVTLVSQYFF